MQHWVRRLHQAGTSLGHSSKRFLQRFGKDRQGVTAIEFAMVAGPFFLILFSMFEVGMTFTANTILQNAVNEAARQVRTGQIQQSAQTDKAKQFRDAVCANMTSFMPCDSDKLQVEVRSFSSAADAICTNPIKANGSFKSSYTFAPGEPGDFVLVCGFYKWDTYTPGLGKALKAIGPGGYILQASAAVRNEPYKGAL